MPTLTVNASFDGTLTREGVDETFATIRGATSAAGVTTSGQAGYAVQYIASSTTTNQFNRLIRNIFIFDTSSLGSSAIITAATLSIYTNTSQLGYAKGDPAAGPPVMGSSNTVVVSASPASDTAFVKADYSTLGSTSLATGISWASWATTANTENAFSLNADGLAAINKTGNTRFGMTSEWDRSGTFGGTWVSGSTTFVIGNSLAASGTSYDPKLTVTYNYPTAYVRGARQAVNRAATY